MPAYSEQLSRKAEAQLRRLGVEVRTSQMVTGIEPGAVWVGDQKIPSPVILWAAGVAASPLGKKLGVPVDRAGRVEVEADLSIPGHPEVFVIGDLAALKDESGKLLPGVAQVAIQQGDWVGETIARDLEKQPRRPFHYHDKGSLATIGRAAAVAKIGRFELSGYFAWLAWPQSHSGYDSVGVVVSHLRARRTPHYWQRRTFRVEAIANRQRQDDVPKTFRR